MLHNNLARPHLLRLAGCALVLLLVVGLYGLHAARQSHAGDAADVAVTLVPMPNVGVTPGSIISYQVRVKNFGSGSASRVLVHMPYDPGKLTVLDASFERSDDWVTGVRSDYLTMIFGSLGSYESRTATIRMYVADLLPVGTVIDMWAGYGWDDDNGGGADRSANAAPVVVEQHPISSGAVWMAVDPPAGPSGTIYSFFSDRFAPGEEVHTSLNAPFGTQPLPMQTTADQLGRIWIIFTSTGYPPGTYEMVVRSTRTEQIATATFVIE